MLWEVRDYLGELVLIGGWVPFVYRHYGPFETWTGAESRTFEVDLAVPTNLPPSKRGPLSQRLRVAGFEPSAEREAAAVWVHEPATGEKIEFFMSHAGHTRAIGRVRPVHDQTGLGAISLEGLWFLTEYSRALRLPAQSAGGRTVRVDVRVPLLGAFAVNKARTFPRRSAAAEGGREKRAKDILYIRDLMVAGPEVVEHIEGDLTQFREAGAAVAEYLRSATQNLRLLVGGQWPDVVQRAGAMLMERGEAASPADAVMQLRGYAADFLELLENTID